MDLEKNLPLIIEYFGVEIGSAISIILLITFAYTCIFKSGLVQHLWFLINFKSWLIDKDIERNQELIDRSQLDESVKKNYRIRQDILFLQRSLKTKEVELGVLEFLSGYIDTKKAVKKYEESKAKLRFDHTEKKLKVIKKIPDYKVRIKKIIIFFIYWLLAGPPGLYFIYFYNKSVELNYVSTIDFILSFPPLIVYTIYVFTIAFLLRYCLKDTIAYELLSMKRFY